MRLFIATHMPEAVTGPLNDVIRPLRMALPNASWVRAGSEHLTYAFLGEHEESAVDSIAKHVRAHVHALPGFEAVLRGSGFFPNARRPRVCWLGMQPAEPFSHIADAVRAGLREAAITFDDKPFHPHLTLVRIRDPWRLEDVARFENTFADFESAPIAVTHASLYSSKLTGAGAVHAELVRFDLARPEL
jgi:RNA 2',3'-cyclic 3'-phosphodiesterase